MNFTNVNSFKAKIKNIAKEKAVPPQQIQQSYLIEQVLRMISKSVYKNHFIVKGGYLIGNMIGVEKRTTMDLDVSIKNEQITQLTFSESLPKEFPHRINDMAGWLVKKEHLSDLLNQCEVRADINHTRFVDEVTQIVQNF